MTGSDADHSGEVDGTPAFGPAVARRRLEAREELARARLADTIGTADLLFAVLDVYGRLFDRVLYLRGTSREELAERLATSDERHD